MVLLTVALSATVIVPQSASAATVFTDTFTRSDSNNLGSGWQVWSSSWGVRSGKARALSGAWLQTTAITSVSAGSTSYTVDVDITLSPTPMRSNAAVALAVVDYSNNFFCKIEVTDGNPNGLASIGRRVGKTITSQLASAKNIGLVAGGTYHVRCGRQGSTLTMSVVGRTLTYTMGSSDLSRFGSSTKVGLRTHLAPDEDDGLSSYDAFTVSVP